MKTYEELAAGAIARGRELKRRRNRRRVWGSAAAALTVAALILTWTVNRQRKPVVTPPDEEGSVVWNGEMAGASGVHESVAGVPSTAPAALTPESTAAVPDGAAAVTGEGSPGTSAGTWEMPSGEPPASGSTEGVGGFALPRDGRLERVGEGFSDADVLALLQALVSSPTGLGLSENAELTLIEAGHAHVRLPETPEDPAVITADFRDYYVTENGKIAAILTVAKEDGRFFVTPAFGAPWFGALTDFLNAHRGEKLLAVYMGPLDVLIAPDGDLFLPGEADPTALPDAEALYASLFTEEAAYAP